MSNKYSQKLLVSPKNSVADAIKAASKRAIKKNSRSNQWFNW